MKKLLRYASIVMLLAGVMVLAIPFWKETESNESLILGLCMIVCGFIMFILNDRNCG